MAAVNYNAPGQVVIAGSKAAVDRAIAACQEAGAKRAMPLPVSVPSHCDLMRPAADRLAEAMASIELRAPRYTVIQNVDAEAHADVETLRTRLIEQLYQRCAGPPASRPCRAGGRSVHRVRSRQGADRPQQANCPG